MNFPESVRRNRAGLCLAMAIALTSGTASALESDRQQPLEVYADSTDGTLGDGMAILRGSVEISQGSLLVKADVAEVEKSEGRVRKVILTGNLVELQQEIEEQGLVKAKARKIEYEVASGIITLTGDADVDHPQYQIKGEQLKYDMKLEHFQGSGGDSNGRIRIQLDPEVVPDAGTVVEPAPDQSPADESEEPPTTTAELSDAQG